MNRTIGHKASNSEYRRTAKEAMSAASRTVEMTAGDSASLASSAYLEVFGYDDKVLTKETIAKALETALSAKNQADTASCYANDIIELLKGRDPYGDTDMSIIKKARRTKP